MHALLAAGIPFSHLVSTLGQGCNQLEPDQWKFATKHTHGLQCHSALYALVEGLDL